MNHQSGLLLVGHGTRDPRGQQEFLATARQVQALRSEQPVFPCFLELATPTIDDGLVAAYRAGVRRLTVVPMLLFAAGHAKRDIPDAVEKAAARFEDLQLACVADALDCHPAMLWLSELRYRLGLCGRQPVPPAQTALVMIGRGSSDAEATARMHCFAELRRQRTPVGWLGVGFLAVEQPALEEAIEAALASGCRRVVIQPHLLFQGELTEQVRQAAARAARDRSLEVIVTSHLAPGWPLARALADRAEKKFGPSAVSLRNG